MKFDNLDRSPNFCSQHLHTLWCEGMVEAMLPCRIYRKHLTKIVNKEHISHLLNIHVHIPFPWMDTLKTITSLVLMTSYNSLSCLSFPNSSKEAGFSVIFYLKLNMTPKRGRYEHIWLRHMQITLNSECACCSFSTLLLWKAVLNRVYWACLIDVYHLNGWTSLGWMSSWWIQVCGWPG